jgi:hypothetical protein
MTWSWELEPERQGVFWKVPQLETNMYRLFLFDNGTNSSNYAGQEVIKAALKLDPIRCELYRLVYGSLP